MSDSQVYSAPNWTGPDTAFMTQPEYLTQPFAALSSEQFQGGPDVADGPQPWQSFNDGSLPTLDAAMSNLWDWGLPFQ